MFNAWLILRGAATLPLRMRQHCDTALAVAKHLENHPEVEFVRYPGLPNHPQHEIAKKQMRGGFSGMMNVRLKRDREGHDAFLRSLKLITPAVSLGHDISLVVHHSMTSDDPWYEITKTTTDDMGDGFLRLSIGLEDAEDIIDDIEQAL